VNLHLVPCGEVAQRLRVSTNTVRRWCRDGWIKAEQTPGGEWRVLVDEHGRTIKPE
jgi:excisionase family DNA binding protein